MGLSESFMVAKVGSSVMKHSIWSEQKQKQRQDKNQHIPRTLRKINQGE